MIEEVDGEREEGGTKGRGDVETLPLAFALTENVRALVLAQPLNFLSLPKFEVLSNRGGGE
jgi:hypothetical protein